MREINFLPLKVLVESWLILSSVLNFGESFHFSPYIKPKVKATALGIPLYITVEGICHAISVRFVMLGDGTYITAGTALLFF